MGKALGSKRVSKRLLYAGVMVKNVDAGLAFYRDKLGFVPLPGRPVRLRIPGALGDMVELIPDTGTPVHYIALEAASGRKEFHDPDGTRIVLTTELTASPGKP